MCVCCRGRCGATPATDTHSSAAARRGARWRRSHTQVWASAAPETHRERETLVQHSSAPAPDWLRVTQGAESPLQTGLTLLRDLVTVSRQPSDIIRRASRAVFLASTRPEHNMRHSSLITNTSASLNSEFTDY